MVNEFLIETLADYQKLYSELEAMGAPEEALEIVKKSIDDTSSLIKERESRELEARVLLAPVAPVEVEQGLTVGTYKNFKAFCVAGGKLEANAKTPKGDTRKALIRQMDSLCSWRKAEKGNAIIVDEVYQFEKDIEDGRSKKNIYIDSAEALIIHNLKKSTNAVTFITVGNLGEYVGLFNDKYQYADHDTLKVDFTIFNSFKRTTNAEAKRILDRCLKSMENRKLIDSAYTRIIVCKDG